MYGPTLSIILLMIGAVMHSAPLVLFGLLAFGGIVFFQLVNLPVEFDASRRALVTLEQSRVLAGDELAGARRVLGAAAMTYVAAAAVSMMQMVWWLVQILGSQRRED